MAQEVRFSVCWVVRKAQFQTRHGATFETQNENMFTERTIVQRRISNRCQEAFAAAVRGKLANPEPDYYLEALIRPTTPLT